MTEIRVVVETSEWQTRAADPSDKWDSGDTAGQVDNVYAELASAPESASWYSKELVKNLGDLSPGDTVYAVVVDYESGNTFGRAGGYAQIMDVFETFEEAEGLYRECVAHAEQAVKRISQGVEYAGKSYYVAWDGLFESVNHIEVWHLVIRGGSESNGVRFRTGH